MESLHVKKWDHEQCSYCGSTNTQFVCWECFQTTIEDVKGELKEEIKKRDKRLEHFAVRFNELLNFLMPDETNRAEYLRLLKIAEEDY